MEEENILLNIEFNNDDIKDAIKNMIEGRKAIDALIEQNRKLVEQGQKNSAAYVKNQESIKALNKEVGENSKIVQANTQAVKANENSIDALKEKNKLLLKERNALSTSTEEGRQKIAELNAEYDRNSQTIKENSTNVEKQRFNIGNYTASIVEAGIQLKKLEEENKNLAVALRAVDKETEEGKEQYKQINTAIQNNITQINVYKDTIDKSTSATDKAAASIKQLAPGAASAAQGFVGMTKAALAFIATPIGAVIAAVGVAVSAAIAYFKQFEPVLDFIEDSVTKVTAVFGSLIQNLDKVASIVGNVLTGNFAAAAAETAALGTELGNAADEAQKLLDATRELEDAELKFRVESAGAVNQMKAWVVESKRKGISIEESNALLQKASDLENKLTEESVKNAQKRADIEEGKLIASRKAQLDAAGIARKAGQSQADFIDELINSGIFSPEALDPLISAYEKVEQEASAGLAFQEKIQNQQAAMDEKEAARLEKLAEQRKKAQEDEQKRLEEIAKKREELLEREQTAENRIAILRLENEAAVLSGAQERADKLIEIEKLKAEQLLANEELTASERGLIQLESDAAINEILRTSRDEQRAEAEKAFEEDLAKYQEYVQGLVNIDKQKLLDGVISQEEYNQEIADLELAALEVQLAMKEQFGEEDIALAGRITDAKIKQKQFEAAETERLEKFKVDAVKNTLGQVASLFNKNSIAFKALAAAQTLIQTYQSAQAVFTGMTSTIPGPVGIALGIAGAAAAVISGLSNVNKIVSTPTPKLEDGGVISIDGKRHSAGGEDVHIGGKKVANVEQGEKMVVLKRGSSKLLRTLSTVNQMVGGVDFFNDRAPKRVLADGGFVARSAANAPSQFNQLSIAEDLKKAKFVVQVSEIDRVQGNVNKADVTSELR